MLGKGRLWAEVEGYGIWMVVETWEREEVLGGCGACGSCKESFKWDGSRTNMEVRTKLELRRTLNIYRVFVFRSLDLSLQLNFNSTVS